MARREALWCEECEVGMRLIARPRLDLTHVVSVWFCDDCRYLAVEFAGQVERIDLHWVFSDATPCD